MTPTDEDLAGRATREALETLYERHAPALLAFLAARSSAADAEDLHHDLWLRVWKHLPDAFHGGNFRAWLFEIARNLLIDRARRKRPDRLDEAVEHVDHHPDASPLGVVLDRERQRVLADCLAKLEKRNATAAALVRGRLGGAGYDELCPRLGLNEGAAYKLWHEAVKQLQTCVERATR